MTHTPGPWRYDADLLEIVSTVAHHDWDDGSDPVPVTIIATRRAMGGDDSDADVLMLAGAEGMYQALKALADEAQRIGDHLSASGQGATMLGMTIRKARAAIEAATP